MNISIVCPKDNLSEVKYILQVYSTLIGVPIHITKKSPVVVQYHVEKEIDLENKIIIDIPGSDDPFESTQYDINKNEEQVTVHFANDIIRRSFNLLNRIEEICDKEFIDGFLHDKEPIKKPWVNIYANQFWDSLTDAAEMVDYDLPEKTYFPDENKFVVVMTHDVDRIKKWTNKWQLKKLSYLLLSLFNFDFSRFKSEFSDIYQSISQEADPFWNFDTIQSIEMEKDLRSTFYFLTEKKDYAFERYAFDKNIIPEIKKLYKNNFEIGLHGSRYSYSNRLKLSKELQKMQEIISDQIGIRQHYLMFDVTKTWFIEDKTGFLYDSTLGYNDDIGFRCGICAPYRLFDKSLWELPLSIMDVALFDKKGYNASKAMKHCKTLLKEVKKYNGTAVILWHQRFFSDEEKRNFYIKLIDWIELNGGIFMRAKDVVQKYKLFSQKGAYDEPVQHQ